MTTPNNTPQEWEERFVEEGAALEHARWSRWQAYLHMFLTYHEIKDGDRTIACYLLSADVYERWERQIATEYKELSEEEKESDRKEVREYLPLVRSIAALSKQQARQEAIEECTLTQLIKKCGEDFHFLGLSDDKGWCASSNKLESYYYGSTPEEAVEKLLSALEKLLPSNKE